MTRLLLLLMAGIATPAMAQHSGQTAAAPSPPAIGCTPEHAAMGHCKLPDAVPAPPPKAPAPALTCTAEHAAMGHCKLPEPVAAPPPTSGTQASTCTPEHAAMGHCKMPEPAAAAEAAAPSSTCSAEHAAMGHCTPSAPAPQLMPAAPSDPTCPPEHAAMGHCTPRASASPEVQPAPPPQEALIGPKHAADAVWGADDMRRGRNILREEHGGMAAAKFLVDRAEARIGDGQDGYLLDAQAWYGGDIDKLWVKGEIEGEWSRKPEHAEVQALWSHAIDPWFDLQAGIRQDLRTGPNRTHLAIGVQGLAPYWWEVEGTFFLSNKGEITVRAEAEYDLRITQKLIFQPRVEAEFSAQEIRELGIGSGLTNASMGARLRYQLSPLFAPYVGVEFERAFGGTRDYQKAEGDSSGDVKLLVGVRAWF